MMRTDYSKLDGEVGIRGDHSLLIRSTEVSETENSTYANLKDFNAVVNENYED